MVPIAKLKRDGVRDYRLYKALAAEVGRIDKREQAAKRPKPPGQHWGFTPSEYPDEDALPREISRASASEISSVNRFNDFVNRHVSTYEDRRLIRKYSKAKGMGNGGMAWLRKKMKKNRGSLDWDLQCAFKRLANIAGASDLLSPDVLLAIGPEIEQKTSSSDEPSHNGVFHSEHNPSKEQQIALFHADVEERRRFAAQQAADQSARALARIRELRQREREVPA